METPPSTDHKIKNRAVALLLGIGVPLLCLQLFRYDEFLHMALKFPKWVVGIFAGPLAGVPLGIMISSFPIGLALASGFATFYAWRFWRTGTFKRAAVQDYPLARQYRQSVWTLALSMAVPLYTILLILRASGSYFFDGLIPFWIDKGLPVSAIKSTLPSFLYTLYACAIAAAFFQTRRYKKRAQIYRKEKAAAEQSPVENLEQIGLKIIPPKLTYSAIGLNGVLILATYFFIKIYGRRGY